MVETWTPGTAGKARSEGCMSRVALATIVALLGIVALIASMVG